MQNNKNIINNFLSNDKKINTIDNNEQKCLKIAIAGLPNAGKSTLTNRLIGEKISIISAKPQTTRDVIRGVLIKDNIQLIIIDTPGIFIPKKNRLLEKKIIKNAWTGILDSEVACIIIDSTEKISDKIKILITDISRKQPDIIFLLNKVDLIEKANLLKLANELKTIYPNFKEIFMISAKKDTNIEKLKNYLFSLAPKAPWLFNEDEITDVPMRHAASEITREKLFRKLKQDLPYSIDVVTDKWEEFENKSIKIYQTINVLKESQKSIVIGKNGEFLKQINIEAREEMEEIFGLKIHLFIFVKVNNNWVENNDL